MAEGTALNPAKYLAMDIASAFKPGFTASNRRLKSVGFDRALLDELAPLRYLRLDE